MFMKCMKCGAEVLAGDAVAHAKSHGIAVCCFCGRPSKNSSGGSLHVRLSHVLTDKERSERMLPTRTESAKRKKSESLKKSWSNPEVYRRRCESQNRPETSRKKSEANKISHNTKEFKERQHNALVEAFARPEVKKHMSERQQCKIGTPAYVKRQRTLNSEEYRARCSQRLKNRWLLYSDSRKYESVQGMIEAGGSGHKRTIRNKKGSSVKCDSDMEYEYCKLLMADDDVVDFDRFVGVIHLIGMDRIYIPDFVVNRRSGVRELIEVKSSWTAKFPTFPFKVEAAIAWCEEHSMTYKIVRESDMCEYERRLLSQ